MSVMRWLTVAAIMMTALTSSAFACSPIRTYTFFFDFRSTAMFRPTLEFMSRNLLRPGLSASCRQYTILGHADTAEANTLEIRVDIERAQAVRDAMVAAGAPQQAIRVEGAMARQLLVPTGPNVREPQNRRVEVTWSEASGRRHCDPEVERVEPKVVTTCGGPAACYVELSDGTICNFDGVPDPNPQRYSIIR